MRTIWKLQFQHYSQNSGGNDADNRMKGEFMDRDKKGDKQSHFFQVQVFVPGAVMFTPTAPGMD